MALNLQMALLRRPLPSAIVSLLLALLFLHKLNLVLASSGGVMGGSFFDSESSSSSSESFSSDKERVMEQHQHHPHSHDTENATGSSGAGGLILFFIFIFGFFLVGFCKDSNGNSITVLKLQVATLGATESSIQKDLTRIAEAADTSSPEGVSYLLSETILALHKHPGYDIAGYSSVDLKRNRIDGEKSYNQLSNVERAKFDEETLVNLNNVEKINARSQSTNVFNNEHNMLDVKSKEEGQKFEEARLLGFGNEFVVITILVAAKGAHKLPNINGAEDLKKALQKLRSILSSNLLAGQVLWTPQKEDDTLSERQLIEDYPQLANAMKRFLVKKQE